MELYRTAAKEIIKISKLSKVNVTSFHKVEFLSKLSQKCVFLKLISSARKHCKSNARAHGYGHTALKAPHPVCSAKTSNAGPG